MSAGQMTGGKLSAEMLKVREWERHPLSAVWPEVEGEEFDDLVEDVKANGVLEPVVRHEDMVLDGWNRYRAAKEAGRGLRVTTYRGDDPAGFVISKNGHRRHLTAGERAACVVKTREWQPAGRPKGDDDRQVFTNAQLAKEAQVSESTIRDAKRAEREGHGDDLRSGKETLASLRKKREAAKGETVTVPVHEVVRRGPETIAVPMQEPIATTVGGGVVQVEVVEPEADNDETAKAEEKPPLTPEQQVQEVWMWSKESTTNADIAAETGVDEETVRDLRRAFRAGYGTAIKAGEETLQSIRAKEAEADPVTRLKWVTADRDRLENDIDDLRVELKESEEHAKDMVKDHLEEAKQLQETEKALGQAEAKLVKAKDRAREGKKRAEAKHAGDLKKAEDRGRRKGAREARDAMIVAASNAGHPPDRIAEWAGVHVSTVRTVIKKAKAGGGA